MPDFENWIAYFSDELVQENEIPKPAKKDEVAVPVEAVPASKPTGKGQTTTADLVDPNAI